MSRKQKRVIGIIAAILALIIVIFIVVPKVNEVPKKKGHAAAGVCGPLSTFVSKINRRFSLITTSTTGGGHATGSYHYRGMAIDISGSPGNMFRASQYIKSTRARGELLEAIHRPNMSIKNGRAVAPSFWGGAVWFNHGNHIHLAGCNTLLASAAGAVPSRRRQAVIGDRLPLSLGRRSHGHNVCTAQKRLNRIRGKNTRKLKITCKYNTATKNRVVAFQKGRRLRADGVVGVRTWTRLKRAAT